MSAVVAGDGQVTVSWQPPLGAPFPIVAYEVTPWIQRVKQTPVRFDASATTQIVKGLRNLTHYTFTVKAINALGNDSASSAASVSVTPTGAPSPVTFASFVAYPRTGGGLAVGDVNDDGVPDMVSGGYPPDGIGLSVRLGAGDGTFGAPIVTPAGASAPVLTDVNGDALVDVVTIDSAAEQVSVLRGDGTGHFGAEARYATGMNPIRLTVADLNGDDVDDIVTSNATDVTGGSVSVLLGNGDGTFAPRHDYAAAGSYDLVVADLNSDAIPDLAVGREIRLGNGDGTFGTATTLNVSGWVSAAGDMNGDGHADLVMQSGDLKVLLGNGDGTFALSGVYTTIGCQCVLKLADMNGDGILDVELGGNGGSPSAASVSINNGDGTLAPHTDFSVGVFGGGDVSDIEVGDFNGDGLPDLAADAYNIPDLGEATSFVAVLLNRPGVPLAPTIGTAQGSDHSATVSWTAPPSNDTYPITGYIVTPQVWQSYTTLPPTTFNSTATTQTVTGLTNSARYVFRVQAVNAIGVGQYSERTPGNFGTLVGKLPNPPTIGAATAGDTTATVSWTAPTPVGFAVTSYTVTPYVGAVAQTPTTFGVTPTTQTVTGLTNGTTYQFRVQATNDVGTGPASGLSNAVTPFTFTVPDAPTIGTATAGNGQATVSWTAPAYDGGSALNGYIVTPYVDGTALAPRQFFSTATTQVIKNLTNGTTYTFTVAATNGVGTGSESQQSNPVTPGP